MVITYLRTVLAYRTSTLAVAYSLPTTLLQHWHNFVGLTGHLVSFFNKIFLKENDYSYSFC